MVFPPSIETKPFASKTLIHGFRRIGVLCVKGLAALIAFVVVLLVVVQFSNTNSSELPPKPEGALRVASYNVHFLALRTQGRFADGPWSQDGWEQRKSALDAQVKALDADLIGFQEMETFSRRGRGGENLTRAYLLEQNPAFAAAARGPVAEFPNGQPVFYRTDRLSLLDQGWFFFSNTPDRIYSRTFNGSWPAYTTWARFEDISGETFVVFNAHFDFSSRSNRLGSAELVAERVLPRIDAGEKVIVLGDFNTLQNWKPLQLIEAAGIRFPAISGASFHMNRGVHLFGAIDHIGISENISQPVTGPLVLQDKTGETFGSDHYPIVADLVF